MPRLPPPHQLDIDRYIILLNDYVFTAYCQDIQVPVCPLCNKAVPVPRGEQPDIKVITFMSVSLICSYHNFTSSVIYYEADTQQHEIYLFYFIKKENVNDVISMHLTFNRLYVRSKQTVRIIQHIKLYNYFFKS